MVQTAFCVSAAVTCPAYYGARQISQPKRQKGRDMLKNKEKDQTVKAGAEMENTYPAIITEIAQGVSGWFEYATEYGAFENDEDDQVTELLLMLYRGGSYREAVKLLKLVFTSMNFDSACAMLSLIHDSQDDKREEAFVRAFMTASTRCRFHEAVCSPGGPCAGEEQ